MSQQIAIIEKEVSPFIISANKLLIKTPEDMLQASETLSQLNIFNDRLKEDREKITAPINEALREIRAKYKPTESSLAEAIGIVRTKMGEYQMQAIAAEKRAAEDLRNGKIDLESAAKTVAESRISVTSGDITFRTVQTLKIVDASKIPKKYLVPDEDMILNVLKSGKKVAGCEIEEVQSVINRRK